MIKKIPSLLLTPLLSIIWFQSYSQIGWDSLAIKSKNRFFYGVTYNIFPDIEKGPIHTYPYYITDNLQNGPYPQSGYSAIYAYNTNFVSLGGKLRYNVVEFTPRTSLSLSLAPSFGIGLTIVDEQDIVNNITSYATASYNIPFLLEFNYGKGATYNTFDEYGLFVFTGVENTGIFLKNNPSNATMTDVNGNPYTPNLINHWTEAVFGLGVRYKNRKNIEREVFLKYGVGTTSLYVSPYGIVQPIHPWTLKLTFTRNF